MQPFTLQDTIQIANLLKANQIGVMPTDTIYGIHGLALHKEAVERIYQIKARERQKPFIILISALSDLELFNIRLTKKQDAFLMKLWPNPVSVVLPCPNELLSYLHCGTHTLALRMPDDPFLQQILTQTGPLISTSANPAGQPAAISLQQAEDYLAESVDFYVDGGKLETQSSTVVKFKQDKLEILRQGVFKVPRI